MESKTGGRVDIVPPIVIFLAGVLLGFVIGYGLLHCC